MYYYEKSYTAEIEDMLMDFLTYRKSRKLQGYEISSAFPSEVYSSQSEVDYGIGKGWPHNKDYYKSINMPLTPEQPAVQPDKEYKNHLVPSPGGFEVPESSCPCEYKLPACPAPSEYPMLPISGLSEEQAKPMLKEVAKPAQTGKVLPFPKEYSDEMMEKELEFGKHLYNGICKLLHPHVQIVLQEYQYNGSPIYSDYMDKETLAQICDKVIVRAQTKEDKVKEIASKAERAEWDRYHLLRSLAESLILMEIFVSLRPKRREWVKQSWDITQYI